MSYECLSSEDQLVNQVGNNTATSDFKQQFEKTSHICNNEKRKLMVQFC